MLKFSDLAFAPLVEERRKNGLFPREHSIFHTISPNPSTMLEIYKGRRLLKMKYGTLPQRVQYDYCVKCVNESVIPFLPEGSTLVGIAELNQQGHVHFHMLIGSPSIRSDQALHIYRRDVSLCPLSIKNRKNVDARDFMNNIVFADDIDEIIDYCSTDEVYGKTYYFDRQRDPSFKGRKIKDLLRLETHEDWLSKH